VLGWFEEENKLETYVCATCGGRYRTPEEKEACCFFHSQDPEASEKSIDKLFKARAVVIQLKSIPALNGQRAKVNLVVPVNDGRSLESLTKGIMTFLVEVKVISTGKIIHVFYDQLTKVEAEKVSPEDWPEIAVEDRRQY
jgi:hypothetical protein